MEVKKNGYFLIPASPHQIWRKNWSKRLLNVALFSSFGFGFIRHGLNKDNCLGKENTGKSSWLLYILVHDLTSFNISSFQKSLSKNSLVEVNQTILAWSFSVHF